MNSKSTCAYMFDVTMFIQAISNVYTVKYLGLTTLLLLLLSRDLISFMILAHRISTYM